MSKRHHALSLDEKQKIIEAAEQNSNKSDLAKQLSQQFGRPVPRTTIIGVLKEKEKIQDALVSGSDAKSRKQPAITRQQAQAAFQMVRKYVESNTGNPSVLASSDNLEEFFARERLKKMKQTKITDYDLS